MDTESYAAHASSHVAPMSELVAALRSAFDERGSAEERLRRVSELLRDAEKRRTFPPTVKRGGLAPWQVRKVRSFIEEHLTSLIRSASLASIVRLTPGHFIRAFGNSFGESPMEYVIRLRIQRAQRLMLSTTSSLSEIALECGFTDQPYFSRLFRRVVGETPGGWRRARVEPLP